MTRNEQPTPAPAEIAHRITDAAQRLGRVLPDAFVSPGDAFAVVLNLQLAADELPSVIEKTLAYLLTLEDVGGLRAGPGESLTDALTEVQAGMTDASAAANAVYSGLRRAQAALARLGWVEG
ncbi:hypothetical protein AB0B15_42960 [Streptomyces sp. NPDC045456]|uniref:hypothetical protein n=1 Tax=Streptomyces sp. NPDC045456 TaxID=3155254 RepID=UPI0033ED56E3